LTFGVPIQGPTQATSTIPSGPFNLNLGSTPMNGNTLILWVTCQALIGANPSVSSVSQNGVTWKPAIQNNDSTTVDVEIWYGTVAAMGTPGTQLTITLTSGGGTSPLTIADCSEFPGGLTLDQTQVNAPTVTGTSCVTGTTGATTVTQELSIGCIGAGSNIQGDVVQSQPLNNYNLGDGAEIFNGATLYGSLGCLYLVLASIQTASSGTSFVGITAPAGCIATFYAAPAVSTSQVYGDGLTSYTC
jgi:hypothetical protein